MEERQKKGRFADWKLSDWCIYAGFILLCLILFYAAWNFIKTGLYFRGFLLGICAVLLSFLCFIPVFSKPVSKNENNNAVMRIPLPKTSEGFIELAKSIGLDDAEIQAELMECLDRPESFLEKMEKQIKSGDKKEQKDLFEDLSAVYEEYKGLNLQSSRLAAGRLQSGSRVFTDYAKDGKEPFLQGALTLLDHRNILAIFDWKTDRETFVYRMKNLKTVNAYQLPVDEKIFPEWGAVEEFCPVLDKLWEQKGFITVLIDNDSDESIVGVRRKNR